MDKYLLLKAKTHQGISQVLDEHQTEWANFTPLAVAKAELDTLLSKANTYRQVLQDNSKGVTDAKKITKERMKTNIQLLHSAMTAFADYKKDVVFQNQLKTQWLRFYSSRRELELYNCCQYIYTLADGIKTDLTNYKVTQAMLNETLNAIKLFHDLIIMPRTVIKSMKLTAQYLKACDKETESLLKNRIDKLMKIISVDMPAFADAYFAIRPIVKTRGKNKSKTVNPSATEGNIPNAS